MGRRKDTACVEWRHEEGEGLFLASNPLFDAAFWFPRGQPNNGGLPLSRYVSWVLLASRSTAGSGVLKRVSVQSQFAGLGRPIQRNGGGGVQRTMESKVVLITA